MYDETRPDPLYHDLIGHLEERPQDVHFVLAYMWQELPPRTRREVLEAARSARSPAT
jgi:hypothetical protein